MKVLIIENDGRLPDNVKRILAKLKPDEVREFTNFQYCDKTDFPAALMACDTILIETTLIHKYQVDEMVALMAKVPSKQIIFTWEDTVKELFEYLENEDDIVKIAHHKIGYYAHTFDIEDGKQPVNYTTLFADNAAIVGERLRIAAEELATRLAKEQAYRDTAQTRPTGQMVLIKTVMASGKQWSTLKEGSIVPALDMSEQDERANRGVWVWGLTEPVKLLNDTGYNEYELVADENTSMREIALEILKIVDLFDPKEKDVFSVIGFIEAALAEDDKAAQLHWCLTAWLDDNDIPRRGNRNKIETYLNKVLAKRLETDLVIN